jgi:hypothetical protein
MTVYVIVDAQGNPVEGWAEALVGGGWVDDTPTAEEIAWLRAGGHLREPRPDDRLGDGSIPPVGCLVSSHPPDDEMEWVALDAEFEVSLHTPEENAAIEVIPDYSDPDQRASLTPEELAEIEAMEALAYPYFD